MPPTTEDTVAVTDHPIHTQDSERLLSEEELRKPYRGEKATYTFGHLLGKGSHGVVYEAHTSEATDPAIPKVVALKVFRGRQDYDTDKRQNVGVRDAAQRGSPGFRFVLLLLDFADEPSPDFSFLVFEKAEFELKDLIRHGRVQRHRYRDELLPILAYQILMGVSAIHSCRKTHHDLKTDNLFVVKEPGGLVVKVGDLGDAVSWNSVQVFKKESVDDIWTICEILLECLTGKWVREYIGNPAERNKYMQKINNGIRQNKLQAKRVQESLESSTFELMKPLLLELSATVAPPTCEQAIEVLSKSVSLETLKSDVSFVLGVRARYHSRRQYVAQRAFASLLE